MTMLTQEDIDDLKNYTNDFNDFCRNNVCGPDCKVFAESLKKKISCWSAFVKMKKESTE